VTTTAEQQERFTARMKAIATTIHGNLDRYGKAGCATAKVVERQAIALVISQRSNLFVSHFDTNGLMLQVGKPERTSTNL
jgi:hypothetical protein